MDIEQQIEDLKNALREIMKMISERGEPLSDDMKIKLNQVIDHVANRIQQLRQEQAGAEAPITPQPKAQNLQQAPHSSSNINAFDYDYDNNRLLVKFQGDYPQQNGPVYSYDGVPKYIFDLFRRGAVAPKTSGRNKWHTWKKGVTPSLGAAMHHLIKNGGYPYNKVA